ncbi:ArsS family sensor histidine kinase [uncultured Helicobacter sp.]|uniref:ArsS family sensor histidine kinase n=1 Tax=Helicobacter sp. TaxID=218 RepID=UPI002A7E37CB|nr:ArsS family sensor histidine kinase [Helicobacter sp.]MCI7711431.1 ArsS family sensor histidine kinase [Helicobacter sp.]MDD7345447.1 ArsS family sensor histidine kinase [Helicobacter sp.]MDY2823579.1 ArsS family sensor histidine kinase [Helicobacter sp.]
MKHFWNSIFFKITLLFCAALLGFFALSYFFIKDKIEEDQHLNAIKYNQIVMMLNEIGQLGGGGDVVKKYLHDLGFVEVQESFREQLYEEDEIPQGFVGTIAKIRNTKNGIYILIQDNTESILYRDGTQDSYDRFYLITLAGILMLTFLYVLLLKALIPLNTLRSKIANINSMQVDYIRTKRNPKDEIELLANEFYKFSNKVKALNESRLLFLRSIMHELKTPITKGRITAEMVENPQQKDRLCSVFSRLNELISEFAKIEQLVSRMYTIKKSEFVLEDLIEQTRHMLLVDSTLPNPITLQSPYALIKADFELFAIAIKNMIDNAMKYGNDGKVCIYTQADGLCIENLGNPLKFGLDEYFKPYFRDSKKNIQGFGLGMYIIKNILDNQNFRLRYIHEEGKNIFIIKGCVIENFCDLKNRPAKPELTQSTL